MKALARFRGGPKEAASPAPAEINGPRAELAAAVRDMSALGAALGEQLFHVPDAEVDAAIKIAREVSSVLAAAAGKLAAELAAGQARAAALAEQANAEVAAAEGALQTPAPHPRLTPAGALACSRRRRPGCRRSRAAGPCAAPSSGQAAAPAPRGARRPLPPPRRRRLGARRAGVRGGGAGGLRPVRSRLDHASGRAGAAG